MENYTRERLLEMIRNSYSFKLVMKPKSDSEVYDLYICEPFALIYEKIEFSKAEFLNLMLELLGFMPNDYFRQLSSFYYAETYTHLYTYVYFSKDKRKIEKYIVDDLSKLKELIVGTFSELEFRNQEIFPEDKSAL